MNKTKFEELAIDFLGKLFSTLDEKQIKIAEHWDIDHLCYRVDSLKRYEELKKSFSDFGKLLIESDVNGRPIATFKLNFCVSFRHWSIDVVELPAPKPSKTTPEGFEHIEVVCDLPFSQLEESFKHLKLDLGGLKKDFNQEFEIDLGLRNIKFHHLCLESVIRLEENKPIFKALTASMILKSFKQYTPFVAGTFPLGLQVENSDLDILMCAQNIDQLSDELKERYGHFSHYKAQRVFVDELDSLIVNFSFEQVSFEVFAQNKPVAFQKAFTHFQIEERLLKMGGDEFQKAVITQRQEGLKTEPAFAQVLGLKSDPFNELLILQKATNEKLRNILESL